MSCAICAHAKIDAINTALDHGVAPGILIRRYRLEPVSFGVHVGHRCLVLPRPTHPATGASIDRLLTSGPEPVEVIKNPFAQFKHAWQQAKDDRRVQQAMVAWLNEQLQSDDMGLP